MDVVVIIRWSGGEQRGARLHNLQMRGRDLNKLVQRKRSGRMRAAWQVRGGDNIEGQSQGGQGEEIPVGVERGESGISSDVGVQSGWQGREEHGPVRGNTGGRGKVMEFKEREAEGGRRRTSVEMKGRETIAPARSACSLDLHMKGWSLYKLVQRRRDRRHERGRGRGKGRDRRGTAGK